MHVYYTGTAGRMIPVAAGPHRARVCCRLVAGPGRAGTVWQTLHVVMLNNYVMAIKLSISLQHSRFIYRPAASRTHESAAVAEDRTLTAA